MKSSLRIVIPFLCLLTLALIPGLFASPASAQTPPPGVVALVGTDGDGVASIYIVDLASGQTGHLITPVSPNSDLAWHPEDNILAFATEGGGYGLLSSLRGCFEGVNLCADTVEVLPPFVVEQVEWLPGGNSLYFVTDEGVKFSAPRARPDQITDESFDCTRGLSVDSDPYAILCANEDSAGNVQTLVYQPGEPDVVELYTIGTYPGITVYDIGANAQSVVGTLESAGDSAFYAAPDTASQRLANYQIHVYDVAFNPDGTQIALAGATSDSTGDGSLRDGDMAELYLYDTASGSLQQIPGFTDATTLTWSPDGAHVLVVHESSTVAIYTLATQQRTSVTSNLPDGLTLDHPGWHPADETLPVLAPPATATPIPTLTQPALPTFTSFPTFTAFPTFTQVPTATPGSPMGVGCDQAFTGTAPVAVGDTAEVTTRGAAIRLRSGPALTATLLRELAIGARMKVLDGFYCAQGYRWWQVQIEDTGQVGYLADSDEGGFWIQKVNTPQPTATRPALSVNLYADAYSLTQGQCTVIHWEVEGIKAVYFENQGVVGNASRQVCPNATTTYTLRIIRVDDTEFTQTVTITVQ